jgi:pimeloyl-ACP methyl ester carboxylesterase
MTSIRRTGTRRAPWAKVLGILAVVLLAAAVGYAGEGVRKGYADTPAGQIHYRTAGSGEPVLLLHQTPTSSNDYQRVIPFLTKKYKVVAMDTLGYGNSDLPKGEPTIALYAQTVGHFMDSLGIKKAHVVGHHTGAMIAVELAATQPERIDKLVLSGCPAWSEEERNEMLSSPGYAHVKYDAEGKFLMSKWNAYKSFCAEGAKPEVWYPSFADSVNAGTHVHDGHVAAFKHDILKALPLVKQPTLLVSGDRDMFLKDLKKTADLMPGCKTTKVIPGGGVLLALEAPENFAKAILEFLEQ